MDDIKTASNYDNLSVSTFLTKLKSLGNNGKYFVQIDKIVIEIIASISRSILDQRIYTVRLNSKKKHLTLDWEGFCGESHTDGTYTYISGASLWDDISIMVTRYDFGYFNKYQTKLREDVDQFLNQVFDQALDQY